MLRRQIMKTADVMVMRKILPIIASQLPGRLITRKEDNQPYLYRYYLTEEKPDSRCTAVLHRFVSSDPYNEVHSHPWEWATSFILSGGYKEIRYKGEAVSSTMMLLRHRQETIYLPGDVNVLHADDYHRAEIIEPTWTLFLYGPRRTTWGFANEQTGEFREITRRTADAPEVNNIPKTKIPWLRYMATPAAIIAKAIALAQRSP